MDSDRHPGPGSRSLHVTSLGFVGSKSDTSLFVYRRGPITAYLLVYVDDIILTASSPAALTSFITALSREFDLKDLASLHYFLGVSVSRTSSGMFLSQRKYAEEILDRAKYRDCNPCTTPVDTSAKLSSAAVTGPLVDDPTLFRSLAGALQ